MEKVDRAKVMNYEKMAAAIREDRPQDLSRLVSRSKSNSLSKAMGGKPSLHDSDMDAMGLLNVAASSGAKECTQWCWMEDWGSGCPIEYSIH